MQQAVTAVQMPRGKAEPREVRRGFLCFHGTPVFETEGWHEDGMFVLRPTKLDLIATAEDKSAAAQKLGAMVLELFEFLASEVEDRTEAEGETLHLLVDRLGPA